MIRATTPTVVLTLPDTVDISSAPAVYVTFSQPNLTITKELGDDMWITGTHVINVYLSQTETLQFPLARPISIQANWITSSGAREATLIESVWMSGNLIPEVIGE